MASKFAITCVAVILTCFGRMLFAEVPATQPSAEYYIGGEVERPGVYTIGQPHVTVLMAITSAGQKDAKADYQITVKHVIVPHKLEQTTTFNSLIALRDAPEASFDLAPGDTVKVVALKP